MEIVTEFGKLLIPLFNKVFQLILTDEERSLSDDLYNMRTLDEWSNMGVVVDWDQYQPSVAIGHLATLSGDNESSIVIGYLSTLITDDKSLDIKLSPLPDTDNDESYRAWLELVTQSHGLPSELVNTPPKQ